MDTTEQDLDAHARPPRSIRDEYKRLQKLPPEAIFQGGGIVATDDSQHLVPQHDELHGSDSAKDAFTRFCGSANNARVSDDEPSVIQPLPGLFVYPSLLPPEVQILLLEKLFHRDLSNPDHMTNVHMHYNVPYPKTTDSDIPLSYFNPTSAGLNFEPKSPDVHKPISTKQYLTKKLRWMTLGGQYDWTKKIYPDSPPPPFPPDIKDLIEGLFPMRAEAAIVNLYSPGDTLSLHRDVSEECEEPLVSISLGCDGIFIIGLEGNGNEDERFAAVRLRSGDAVLMSGVSRYAWHGVPKVLEGTCPEWLAEWPSDDSDGEFGEWRHWMAGKRINLNVRQMYPGSKD